MVLIEINQMDDTFETLERSIATDWDAEVQNAMNQLENEGSKYGTAENSVCSETPINIEDTSYHNIPMVANLTQYRVRKDSPSESKQKQLDESFMIATKELCKICKLHDPHVGKNSYGQKLEWIGCDCSRWFHKSCISFKDPVNTFSCASINIRCLPKRIENILPCDHCKYTANSVQQIQRHIEENHLKELMTARLSIIADDCQGGVSKKALIASNDTLPTDLDNTYYDPDGEFDCMECGLPFSTLNELQGHFVELHYQSLKSRIRVQHLKKSFSCHCGEWFLSSNVLNVHIQTKHMEIKDMPCPYQPCKYSPNENQLTRHILEVHENSKIYQCKSCNYDSVSVENLKNHVFQHAYNDKDSKPYDEKKSLKKKEKFFESKSKSLRLPKKHNGCRKAVKMNKLSVVRSIEHSKDSSKPKNSNQSSTLKIHKTFVRCNKCTQTFMTKEMLQVHDEGIHLGKVPNCPICNVQFRRVSSTIAHIRRLHEKTNKYGDCIQSRQRKEAAPIDLPLNVERIKTSPSENAFQCSSCSRGFMTKEILQVHNECVHKKMSPICPICNKIFSNTSNTMTHIKRTHEKQKFFKCQLCSFEAFELKSMAKHTSYWHTTLRLIKQCTDKNKLPPNITKIESLIDLIPCKSCPMKFYNEKMLKVHTDSIHFRLRPQCPDCHFKAFQCSGVIDHMKRVHEKIKRYRCNLCTFDTYALSTVQTHLKRIHYKEVMKQDKKDTECILPSTIKSSENPISLSMGPGEILHANLSSSKNERKKGYNQSSPKRYVPKCPACPNCSSACTKLHIPWKVKKIDHDHKVNICRLCGFTAYNEQEVKNHFRRSGPKVDNHINQNIKIQDKSNINYNLGCIIDNRNGSSITGSTKSRNTNDQPIELVNQLKCSICVGHLYPVIVSHTHYKCVLCTFETHDKSSGNPHIKLSSQKRFPYEFDGSFESCSRDAAIEKKAEALYRNMEEAKCSLKSIMKCMR